MDSDSVDVDTQCSDQGIHIIYYVFKDTYYNMYTKIGNVSFNDALNPIDLRLYGVAIW